MTVGQFGVLPVGDGSATTYPFDKILKHAAFGDKGDIFAYLMSANVLEQAIEGMEDGGSSGSER